MNIISSCPRESTTQAPYQSLESKDDGEFMSPFQNVTCTVIHTNTMSSPENELRERWFHRGKHM